MPFIYFSCLIAQTKIFNTKLIKSDRSEHLCFVTDLRWKGCFSTWRMMLAVSLLYLAFFRLRLCCLYVYFVLSFYHKWMNFVKWLLTKKKIIVIYTYQVFPHGSVVKNSPANARDTGSIPGLGRFPGEGDGNPLQYSCLGNSMDRRAWRAIVHGVLKSQTWLSD